MAGEEAAEETASWMQGTFGLSGKDLVSGAIALEETRAQAAAQNSGANQAATMQTPTQDSQPQAQTAPTGGGDDSGGGKILGMDRTTAMMVGGGVLALGLVAVMASR